MATQHQIEEANKRVTLPPPRELTKKEKRANWWYYHKWHVIIGVVLAICLLDILSKAFGIGKVKPDYTIAYAGSIMLSEEAQELIRQTFTELSSDMNGDGKVTVELVQYVASDTGDSDSLYYAQAAQTQIVADITSCTSYFFLLEDPYRFQQNSMALCYTDNSLPADTDGSADGKYFYISDCPKLSESLTGVYDTVDLSSLAFAHRGFWTDKTTANAEACAKLWLSLTEGATLP